MLDIISYVKDAGFNNTYNQLNFIHKGIKVKLIAAKAINTSTQVITVEKYIKCLKEKK